MELQLLRWIELMFGSRTHWDIIKCWKGKDMYFIIWKCSIFCLSPAQCILVNLENSLGGYDYNMIQHSRTPAWFGWRCICFEGHRHLIYCLRICLSSSWLWQRRFNRHGRIRTTFRIFFIRKARFLKHFLLVEKKRLLCCRWSAIGHLSDILRTVR